MRNKSLGCRCDLKNPSRASVENTDYEYFAQDDFRVRKPDIKFVFNGKPTHDVAHDIHVRLENPLPIALTKGVFQIEGSGIASPMILKVCTVFIYNQSSK